MTGAATRGPAIADYALIGDCRTAALVSRDGSVDWLCLPSFPGPSVFARLLDPRGGRFSIRPADPFTTARRYLDGTAVLETTFTTASGTARVIDCLPVIDGIGSLQPMREVLRLVEGVRGTVAFAVVAEPRPDYGRVEPRLRRQGRLGWFCAWGHEVLHIGAEAELWQDGTALRGRFAVDAGMQRAFSLSYSSGELAVVPPLGAHARERLTDTLDWWRTWSARVVYTGRHRAAVVRSAITLKLLTFAPSGAIVAAPTTSLPETLGGGRNWDYRYCWLRDAGLTMGALVGLGIHEDARAFLEWMLHATRLTQPRLRIMYDIYGRSGLTEHELPHLAGFRASAPVRIGNGAHAQQQLDVYGEVMLAACTFVAAGGRLDRAGARMLRGLGRVVREGWRDADSGIWEVRGEQRHYTFSKMMCWVALDRLLALHRIGTVPLAPGEVATCTSERDVIAATVEAQGFNKAIGAYTLELNGDGVDAAMLLMPTVGYKPANDPRVVSTYALTCARLGLGGLLKRYEAGADGLDGDEGAFGICSFWAVEQLALRGDGAGALAAFERLLSFGNDLGLFAEEIDGRTGEALGNFPQAFTHVGLINAALAVERALGQAPG